MSDLEYTMELIRAEAENLYRLTRTPEPGMFTWLSALDGSIRRLNGYLVVQERPK